MPEWIEEATLPVRAPRRLMVPHGVPTSVRARRHSPGNETVRVVNEDFDSNGRAGANNVELADVPTNVSWLNCIEA